jgi:predicted anti-sigma-YlaC factor YlaD
MKTSCEIIKDLLPLYYDGVCSNESKTLVEEHLAECDNCKAELSSMGEIIPIRNEVQNMNEAEALKGLSKKWKKGKLKSFLKGALIATLVIIIIFALLSIFISLRITIV